MRRARRGGRGRDGTRGEVCATEALDEGVLHGREDGRGHARRRKLPRLLACCVAVVVLAERCVVKIPKKKQGPLAWPWPGWLGWIGLGGTVIRRLFWASAGIIHRRRRRLQGRRCRGGGDRQWKQADWGGKTPGRFRLIIAHVLFLGGHSNVSRGWVQRVEEAPGLSLTSKLRSGTMRDRL